VTETNPYKSPETAEAAVRRSENVWLWCVCSLAASLLSLLLFFCYGHWHWHPGPWEQTLPGQMGISWSTAVGRAKDCSALLAIVSGVITILIFAKKRCIQGAITLPTCLMSLVTVPIVT
jgi:hypothetical protein